MVKPTDIKEHMRVICKDGAAFVVDHIDGNEIKLVRDDKGLHHWIPLNWVETIDAGAGKLNKSSQELRQNWREEKPQAKA